MFFFFFSILACLPFAFLHCGILVLSGSFSTPHHPFRPGPAEHFSEPQPMFVIIAVVA
jgi:hypothetical protein